jgi:hypothetical protein
LGAVTLDCHHLGVATLGDPFFVRRIAKCASREQDSDGRAPDALERISAGLNRDSLKGLDGRIWWH